MTFWLLLAQTAPNQPALSDQRQVSYLLMLVLTLLVLLVAFLIGVYAMARIGRALRKPSVGGKPTEYSDAWSQYRLSEEDIERATDEPYDERRPPPDDDEERR